MIKRFGSDTLDTLRKDWKEDLAEFGAARGLVFKIGGISYGETHFRCTVECEVFGAPSKREKDYDWYIPRYNLPARGTKFRMNGEEFIITGMNTRARKNKILIDRLPDGKSFVTTVRSVLANVKSSATA